MASTIRVRATSSGETANWGGGVSKDPYVKFAFKGAKKGDDLKVSWVDNKGATDTTTAKIQ
jgi:sulfur-oxidizing protein SoxZ